MTEQQRSKHSILLVDDESEILFSLQGLLRREFTLHTAESGQEALEILRQHPVHVIMTDQRMPQMTGVELMGRVKTEFPDAIRIIFTGYADIKAVVDAINNGGLYRYITKPWDPDELVELLHESAAEYDAMVERRQLLTDVRSHVEEGRTLVNQMSEQAADVDSARVNQHIDNAAQLLERLQQP